MELGGRKMGREERGKRRKNGRLKKKDGKAGKLERKSENVRQV